jgi:CBS domain-containing protein
MHVKDIMSSAVHSVQATDSIARAAQTMGENDVGFLPVLDGRKIVGVVTDRDIAIRGVGAGVRPGNPVELIMTKNASTCSQDCDVEDALQIMASEQVRRLPVCGDGNDLIGVVALADAAERNIDKREVAETLKEICEPTEIHNQSREYA